MVEPYLIIFSGFLRYFFKCYVFFCSVPAPEVDVLFLLIGTSGFSAGAPKKEYIGKTLFLKRVEIFKVI